MNVGIKRVPIRKAVYRSGGRNRKKRVKKVMAYRTITYRKFWFFVPGSRYEPEPEYSFFSEKVAA